MLRQLKHGCPGHTGGAQKSSHEQLEKSWPSVFYLGHFTVASAVHGSLTRHCPQVSAVTAVGQLERCVAVSPHGCAGPAEACWLCQHHVSHCSSNQGDYSSALSTLTSHSSRTARATPLELNSLRLAQPRSSSAGMAHGSSSQHKERPTAPNTQRKGVVKPHAPRRTLLPGELHATLQSRQALGA